MIKLSRQRLRRLGLQFLAVVTGTALSSGIAGAQQATPQGVPMPGPMVENGPYVPQPILPGGIILPLYAPDSPKLNKAKIGEPEKYKMTDGAPGRIENITNIHYPSIEVHTVDARFNTGAAVILVAGGGHSTLNVGTEAGDFVPFFYNYNVNTIILRNRLRSSGYNVQKDSIPDALQSIRLVRKHAKEWGIDPNKIGIIGFSAGAELSAPAALLFEEFDKANSDPSDPLAGVTSRPDWVGILYPGPTPFSQANPPAIPRNAPPAFIASAGSGDSGHAVWALDYYYPMVQMQIPNIELHLYGNGIHANGLKDRDGTPFGTWQDRFVDWYRDLGFLQKPGVETKAAKDAAAFASRPARGGGGAARGQGARGGGRRGANPTTDSTPTTGTPTTGTPTVPPTQR